MAAQLVASRAVLSSTELVMVVAPLALAVATSAIVVVIETAAIVEDKMVSSAVKQMHHQPSFDRRAPRVQ
jgi:hypothetical protein